MRPFDLSNHFTLPLMRSALCLVLLALILVGCTSDLVSRKAGPKTAATDSDPASGTAETQELQPPVYVSDLKPVQPQPSPSDVSPGLSVLYFRKFFSRHLDQLPTGDSARLVGRKGKPIPYLNHDFGKEEVFESGEKRGVGMRMEGLLNFQQTGNYVFQAFLNDGMRVYLDDRLIIDDPKWQRKGDRFSNQAFVDIQAAGWYPIRVEYFQRKGTAVVKLFWRTPDKDELVPIPPQAYGHMPSDS